MCTQNHHLNFKSTHSGEELLSGLYTLPLVFENDSSEILNKVNPYVLQRILHIKEFHKIGLCIERLRDCSNTCSALGECKTKIERPQKLALGNIHVLGKQISGLF